MANKKKKSLLERLPGLLKDAKIGQLNIIDGNVNELCYKKETAATDKKPATPLTHEVLAKAVAAVQTYMWGASAYAVLFCECRDHRGYPNNKSQFEREVDAIAHFDRAERVLQRNDQMSVFAQGGEGALAMMTNDRAFSYDGGGLDRIFTCVYRGIDFLCTGNRDNARVEFNRAAQYQRNWL